MERTSLILCCSAALVLGLASCSAERTDDTVAEPAPRPVDAAPPAGTAIPAAAATLTVATGSVGDYLADGQGRALYMLEGDTDGSMCTGPCLNTWPPLVASPSGMASGATASTGTEAIQAGVRSALVGTIQRADNTTQVSYNGHPLYYYSKDAGPGTTLGHGIGEWYLLTPQGEEMEHDD